MGLERRFTYQVGDVPYDFTVWSFFFSLRCRRWECLLCLLAWLHTCDLLRWLLVLLEADWLAPLSEAKADSCCCAASLRLGTSKTTLLLTPAQHTHNTNHTAGEPDAPIPGVLRNVGSSVHGDRGGAHRRRRGNRLLPL